MTREEAKELLPIIQGYANGGIVEKWSVNRWFEVDEPKFIDKPSQYRIKPEPKYRPFKSHEECWQEMLKHQPFGWAKLIGGTEYGLITDVNDEILYSDAIKEYTFADGTPFGLKED